MPPGYEASAIGPDTGGLEEGCSILHQAVEAFTIVEFENRLATCGRRGVRGERRGHELPRRVQAVAGGKGELSVSKLSGERRRGSGLDQRKIRVKRRGDTHR